VIAYGAFPSLARVPAKVRSPNPQRSHALGNGNRTISSTNLHSCKPPEASWMEARVTKVARGLGKVLVLRCSQMIQVGSSWLEATCVIGRDLGESCDWI
jgi:hypothetical protein